MMFRSLTSNLIRNLNPFRFSARFSSFEPQQIIFTNKSISPYDIILNEDFILQENEENNKIVHLFNDPTQGMVYEMCCKKTERAKRKRRRRKYGSNTTARMR